MRIYEIINEDQILDEGLKDTLISAGMAGIFAIMALTGAPPAKAADGPIKSSPEAVTLVKQTDTGKGGRIEQFSDGSRTESGGWGMRVYDANGTLIKTVSPSVGGVKIALDHVTGNTTTTYSMGPLHASQTVDKFGKQIDAHYNASIGADEISGVAPKHESLSG